MSLHLPLANGFFNLMDEVLCNSKALPFPWLLPAFGGQASRRWEHDAVTKRKEQTGDVCQMNEPQNNNMSAYLSTLIRSADNRKMNETVCQGTCTCRCE